MRHRRRGKKTRSPEGQEREDPQEYARKGKATNNEKQKKIPGKFTQWSTCNEAHRSLCAPIRHRCVAVLLPWVRSHTQSLCRPQGFVSVPWLTRPVRANNLVFGNDTIYDQEFWLLSAHFSDNVAAMGYIISSKPSACIWLVGNWNACWYSSWNLQEQLCTLF